MGSLLNSDDVKENVARNPSTTDEVVAKLIEDPNRDINQVARINLGNRESVSEDILVQLSESPSNFAKEFAAKHRNTPLETLAKLTTDLCSWVSRPAVKNLKNQVAELITDEDVENFVNDLLYKKSA